MELLSFYAVNTDAIRNSLKDALFCFSIVETPVSVNVTSKNFLSNFLSRTSSFCSILCNKSGFK